MHSYFVVVTSSSRSQEINNSVTKEVTKGSPLWAISFSKDNLSMCLKQSKEDWRKLFRKWRMP